MKTLNLDHIESKDCYDLFSYLYTEIMIECTYEKNSNKSQKSHKICPWFHQSLDYVIKKRNYWHNMMRTFPQVSIYRNTFLHYRNEATKVRRKLKNNFSKRSLLMQDAI